MQVRREGCGGSQVRSMFVPLAEGTLSGDEGPVGAASTARLAAVGTPRNGNNRTTSCSMAEAMTQLLVAGVAEAEGTSGCLASGSQSWR